jgi:hypothetical protein
MSQIHTLKILWTLHSPHRMPLCLRHCEQIGALMPPTEADPVKQLRMA